MNFNLNSRMNLKRFSNHPCPLHYDFARLIKCFDDIIYNMILYIVDTEIIVHYATSISSKNFMLIS